jgi:hypothetical protein
MGRSKLVKHVLGWMDEWKYGVKAIVSIAYSNKNITRLVKTSF